MRVATRHGMRKLLVLALLALAVPARADEVIEIHDRAHPAHDARVTHGMPPYSDAAIDSNTWARAWLLLDIDANGFVTRLKLLARPGHDLDRIAIERAFATRFSPALDRAGNAVHSQLVWGIEWPAYWWLREHAGNALPPCRGSGPLQLGAMTSSPVYRDCSEPDLARSVRETWIYPRAATTNLR